MRVTTTSIVIALGINKSIPFAFGLEYLRSEAERTASSPFTPVSVSVTDSKVTIKTSTTAAAVGVGNTAAEGVIRGGDAKTTDEDYDYAYDYDDYSRKVSLFTAERSVDVGEKKEGRSLQDQTCIPVSRTTTSINEKGQWGKSNSITAAIEKQRKNTFSSNSLVFVFDTVFYSDSSGFKSFQLGQSGCSNDSDCCVSTITKKGYCISNRFGNDKRCVECVNGVQCPSTANCLQAGTPNAVCDLSSIVSLPGIEKMARGYDIYKSDPLRFALQGDNITFTAEPDPGFRDPLLDLDFNNGSFDISIGDSAVNIPRGYRLAVSTPRCSSDASTREFQTSSSLREEMGLRLGVDIAGFVGFGYGSSSVFESNVDEKKSVTSSTTSCIQYEVVLEDRTQIALSTSAINWFATNFQGGNSFPDLFDKYGTHILAGASFGAMKGAKTTATESSRNELTSNGEDYEATVKLGLGSFFSFGGGASLKSETEAAESMTRAGVSTVIWSAGDNAIFEDTKVVRGKIPDVVSISGLIEICDILETMDIANFVLSDCKGAMRRHCNKVAAAVGSGTNNGVCSYRTIECSQDYFCAEQYHIEKPICNEGTCVPRIPSGPGVELCFADKSDDLDGPTNILSMTARYAYGQVFTYKTFIPFLAITSTKRLNCFPPFEPPSDLSNMIDITIRNEGERTFSNYDNLFFDFIGLRYVSTNVWIKQWNPETNGDKWCVSNGGNGQCEAALTFDWE